MSMSYEERAKEALDLSEEILSNLEMGDIHMESIVAKCVKLARLREDSDEVKWLRLELSGYSIGSAPNGINQEDINCFAKRSGRTYIWTEPGTEKQEVKHWPYSITEIESTITSNQEKLRNIKTPDDFTPAVSKASDNGWLSGSTFVQETYRDVLKAVRYEQDKLSESIRGYQALLSRIKSRIYDYVLGVNLQLKLGNITESIFQKTKEIVDKKLMEICPDAIKMFIATYNRMDSSNTEEWSQAMSSCRNVLKEFADNIFPPRSGRYIKRDGEEIEVTDDKYKNRLIAFIDEKTKKLSNEYLESRVEELEKRVHKMNDLLAKGAHGNFGEIDINICIIDTYLLIGSLLSIIA